MDQSGEQPPIISQKITRRLFLIGAAGLTAATAFTTAVAPANPPDALQSPLPEAADPFVSPLQSTEQASTSEVKLIMT